ncbi:hypothetical protein LOK85_12235 [Xylella fastidiosa subsp. multiplex]|nr:hypothetical protein [Xylella fastidiosa]MDC6416643.1 hypothetical protein [Xylella fastidiosa subsp. multiplex]
MSEPWLPILAARAGGLALQILAALPAHIAAIVIAFGEDFDSSAVFEINDG